MEWLVVIVASGDGEEYYGRRISTLRCNHKSTAADICEWVENIGRDEGTSCRMFHDVAEEGPVP